MDPSRSHQEEQQEAKTSPTSVVLVAKSGRLEEKKMETKRTACAADAIDTGKRAISKSSTEIEESPRDHPVNFSEVQKEVSPDGQISEGNKGGQGAESGSKGTPERDASTGLASSDHIAKSDGHERNAKSSKMKQSVSCRLRIRPPTSSPPIHPADTLNLDTIASVACKIAKEESRGLVRKAAPSVSFSLPATILGKRPIDQSGAENLRKVQRKCDAEGRGSVDVPSTAVHQYADTVTKVGDMNLMHSNGRPVAKEKTLTDPATSSHEHVEAMQLSSTFDSPTGTVQDAVANHVAAASRRLGLTGGRAERSAEEQVSMALRNSTCRSAMQDVLQHLEDFKYRVATEFGSIRQELEETRSYLRFLEVENGRLKESAANCQCHGSSLSPEPSPAGPSAPGNTVDLSQNTGRVTPINHSRPLTEERGDGGQESGGSPTGGSQSSGSQVLGQEGSSLLVLRPEPDTNPVESGGRRRITRKVRTGGVTKRRRDNWTAAENEDFLRIVRENAGMEEMQLRRKLARHFSPRRTHEQCANHLRILRAQKKVPPAVGEAVPYRQRGTDTDGQ